MKTSKKLVVLLLALFSQIAISQMDLSAYTNIDGVHITSHWGEIKATGTESGPKPFVLDAVLTNELKNPQQLKDLKPYIDFKVKDRTLFIETRNPQGFESIDLNLRVPKHLFVQMTLLKGGNIFASHLKNGVEVNIFNGSVQLQHLGNYALVNAANGEIVANFDSVDSGKPISLVTMNGGVTVSLPEGIKRDVRLISRQNGYVLSDFELDSEKKIINLNVQQYSKKEIKNTAKINGGGALLFLSTENGPIAIRLSEN